jgi:hypothetical protein
MTRPGRYPQELRQRAVRLVFEHQDEHPSQWAAICSIAHKFGMSAAPPDSSTQASGEPGAIQCGWSRRPRATGSIRVGVA